MFILANVNPIEELTSKQLFEIFGIAFTNHMFVVAVAAALLAIGIPLSMRSSMLVRSGPGNMIEAVCVFLRDDVVKPFLGSHTDRYIPVLWTLFFFILTMNLLGMVPLDKFFTLVSGHTSHWGGSPTANIWITGSLAFFSFILFHAAGMYENGPWTYIKNFTPKVPTPLMPFLFFIELVSSFVRMFSLSIRLFANIMAGHIMLGTIMGFIFLFRNMAAATASIAFVVALSMLELFVAFVQSYIFVFLTTIFISFAVHQEH
jgi:F-type H+-transporting ATPase subunit a